MHVREIMTSPVTTITAETSLAEAARQMLALDVGMLPVANGREIIGMVSDRDITVRAVAKGMDPERTGVREFMTKEVFTCAAADNVKDACDLMEQKQVRRLLVTDGAGAPVGIVSLGDIALHLRREESGDVLNKVSQPG